MPNKEASNGNKEGESTSTSSASSVQSSSSSASSSGSSSPTLSDDARSEIASSFESTATSSAPTTNSNNSPLDVLKISKEVPGDTVTKASMNAKATVFNPSATPFNPTPASAPMSTASPNSDTSTPSTIPAATPRYPHSLSLRGSNGTTPVATPPPGAMRFFTAPAASPFTTAAGNGNLEVIRQPKGPVDEDLISTNNFSAMIRRKAILGLKGFGVRKQTLDDESHAMATRSPVTSPVLGGFPRSASPVYQDGEMGSPQLGSGGNGSSFAAFGEHLAQRAMKRRSAQMHQQQYQQQMQGMGYAIPATGNGYGEWGLSQ